MNQDKDILQDLLTTEKQVISTYSNGITESSCQNLRKTLVDNFTSTQNIQYKIFDCMSQKGWYPRKDAPDNEVTETKNKSNQLFSEIK